MSIAINCFAPSFIFINLRPPEYHLSFIYCLKTFGKKQTNTVKTCSNLAMFLSIHPCKNNFHQYRYFRYSSSKNCIFRESLVFTLGLKILPKTILLPVLLIIRNLMKSFIPAMFFQALRYAA